MKTIVVTSKKHGVKEIYVDDEDFEIINKHTWHVCQSKTQRTFYASTNIKLDNGRRTSIEMHRLLIKDAEMVDHADQNGLNNQRYNLRKSTRSDNGVNRVRKKHSSNYHGVKLHKSGKYIAAITRNTKVYHLGYFENEVDAAKAYDTYAKKLHGQFATLNFKDHV